MKFCYNVLVSGSLLCFGPSTWALEPSNELVPDSYDHYSIVAPVLQLHRDLMFCDSAKTCSCAIYASDVSDNGCSYDDNSGCTVTCPGVCNGKNLKLVSTAICPYGTCEISAYCDNGRGCFGPCDPSAQTVEDYCSPLGCSSTSGPSSPSSSSSNSMRNFGRRYSYFIFLGIFLLYAGYKCCLNDREAREADGQAEEGGEANEKPNEGEDETDRQAEVVEAANGEGSSV